MEAPRLHHSPATTSSRGVRHQPRRRPASSEIFFASFVTSGRWERSKGDDAPALRYVHVDRALRRPHPVVPNSVETPKLCFPSPKVPQRTSRITNRLVSDARESRVRPRPRALPLTVAVSSPVPPSDPSGSRQNPSARSRGFAGGLLLVFGVYSNVPPPRGRLGREWRGHSSR